MSTRRASGVSPRTTEMARLDRVIREHGLRAPRRKIVDHREGAWATNAVLSCGHEFLGRGSSELGRKITCYECQAEKARAILSAKEGA